MQKIQRPRQLDFSKSIVKLSQAEEFILEEEKKEKTQIIKPETKDVPKPEIKNQDLDTNGLPSKKRKQINGYIRLEMKEELPKNEKYELNENDREFLKKLPNPPWSHELLEVAIETAEKLSTRELMVKFEDFEEPCKLATGIATGTGIQEIYNYIKNFRETFKRPLLRILWKPSAEEQNNHVAFRPRDKEKMKLRRNKENDKELLNKVSYLKKMKSLKGELEMAKTLLEGVRLRETIKIRQIEMAINPKSISSEETSKLYSEIKQYLSKPSKQLPQRDIPLIEKSQVQVKIIPKEQTQVLTPDENKEYDVSAFICTLLLEGINRNLVPAFYLDSTKCHQSN